MKRLTLSLVKMSIYCHFLAGCDCQSKKPSQVTAMHGAPMLKESSPEHGKSAINDQLSVSLAKTALIELVESAGDRCLNLHLADLKKADTPIFTGSDGEMQIGGFWCDLTKKSFEVSFVGSGARTIRGEFLQESGKWRAVVTDDMIAQPPFE